MADAPAPTNVVEALARVMAELPGIAKVRHPNPSGKGLTYAYRGIEEITSEVQGLFAKYGIVVAPLVRHRKVKDIIVNGNDWTDTYLEVAWNIYGPGGITDVIEAVTYGHGRDNSDKGTNKAMTQAFKYLLLDMLCISDPADDNDGTNIEGVRPVHTAEPRSLPPAVPIQEYETVNGEQIPLGYTDDAIVRTGPGGEDGTPIGKEDGKKLYGYMKRTYGDDCDVPAKISQLLGRQVKWTSEVTVGERERLRGMV